MKTPVLRAPSQVRWVVDIGPERVAAVAGLRESSGRIRVLGAGESPAEGFHAGRVLHAGDATESVADALRKAERSSGAKASDILYTCCDAGLVSQWQAGGRLLAGEGQIRTQDVRLAREIAERIVSRFERKILYAKELYFVVDDRDTMVNPVGVFGRKLEAVVHIVTVEAPRLEILQKIFRRAGFVGAQPVLSIVSSVAAISENEDTVARRVVVDASRDVVNVCSQKAGVLWRCAAASGEVTAEDVAGLVGTVEKDCECEKEVLLTGSRAEDEAYRQALEKAVARPVRVVGPVDAPGLEWPRYASLAGLFKVQLQSRRPSLLKVRKGALAEARNRATAFFNEYF